MEALEELKAIITGKPKGATHINNNGEYIGEGYTGILLHHELGGWHNFDCNAGMRSLSDIERIIELMETLESFKDKVVEDKSATCAHDGGWIARWDHGICTECKCVKVDASWGVASRKWFKNLEEAKFYKKNGVLPK